MSKRILVVCVVVAETMTVWAAQASNDALVANARAIHERVMTIDTHIDFDPAHFTAACNYTRRLVTQVNLPKMRDGGLDVAFFVVQVPQGPLTPAGYADAYRQAVEKFDAVHRLTEQIAPKEIQLALSSGDVSRIAQSGRKVAVIGIENGYPIGTDLSRVREFYGRGARYMGLAHTGHNQLADSHSGEGTKDAPNNGVSRLGREVIAEMNRLGMVVDISHMSRMAALQAIALSKAPVIASHSAVRALVDHNRNLDDEQLVALKTNGGVVQIVAYAGYLKAGAHSGRAPIRNAVAAGTVAACPIEPASAKPLSVEGRPGVKELVDHIDYAVKLIGVDHVGIASDFDGGGGIEGWDSAADTVNVTIELVRRGYSEDDIAKLWGRNLLRVWADVERLAAR
ncbi:MAG TPA: dipeptidase [Vicinamibacterales bacterium]